MLKELDGYDWEEAFAYADFERGDVAAITHLREGANDEESWLLCGRLSSGKWFMLEAWCDYTGWD